MPAPSRPLPRAGGRARIFHFGGEVQSATVVRVLEEGRRVQVRDEDGELLEFVLSPATARFVMSASPYRGPRLELLAP